ncbi:MAG TPA: arabinofuranosidase catalytic domain-containing protein, partial [Pseudonocardiaceae bacterium]
TNWYFTIHGLSYGGPVNDSQELLDAIDTEVDAAGAAAGVNYSYTVGGDFNVEPAQLAGPNGLGIPPGSRIINSNQATQQSGRELDYFVTDDQTSPPTLANGRAAIRQNGAQADHYAVRMGALRAASLPPSLDVMFQGRKCVGCDSSNGLLYKGFGVIMAATIAAAASLGMKRSVNFVGDDTSTSGDGTPQEGSAGEDIGADAAADTTAIPKYKPNVVMLQAGAQDLLDGNESGAPGELSALIDQIQAADPTVVVMVATLDPMANANDESLVTAYNNSVQQLVAAKVAAGQRVVLADMSDLTTADLDADGVTPNASGQQKVAGAFTSALLDAEVLGWITEPVSATAPSGSVCDIYAYYGTACVGAYSMTRAMYSDYFGPLYEVQRASDNQSDDIGVASPGGVVDASEQDSFCAGTTCRITEVFDQSPQLNNLPVAPGGGANPNGDQPADANALPITIGNDTKAYGLDITPGTGYRDNVTRGVATGSEPEGMYMVASGTHVNSGCCNDFGNAETDTHDDGNGRMDAVNLGTNCYYGNVAPCSGNGPWVAADMENGLFQGGNGSNPANKGNGSNYVTAMLKNNGTTTYALKGGDAQSGGLSTWWNGGLPDNVPGYRPMQKQGAIILGIGGDNSNASAGSFFEGVMTDGYPSDAADNAVQANIVAAKYSGNSGGVSTSNSAAGAAVVHDGYASVYTAESANGHLQESYLPQLGGPWHNQDLTAQFNTPPIMPGTTPVSLVHDGYTSVYTVAASTGHVWETYLPKLGDGWTSQDLTTKYNAPTTSWTPTAVVHDGYTSVYTVAAGNGHLWETYLPKLGDSWTSQDLSATNGHTPQVQAGTSPVAIVHGGYTSVYTVDPNHHLQETYLPKLGDSWSTQDLSAMFNPAPVTSVTPTAVVHQGYTSLYTVDDGSNDLRETYLPAIGDTWRTQDLSANYKTPPVAPGTQPVALYHTGYTSVYTVDQGSQHVQETYLSAVGQSWNTQDFTDKYQTPVTAESPIVLVHPASGGDLWTSVYTVGEFNDHLEESYLPAIGDNWTSQDLTTKYPSPPVAASGSSAAGWSVAHDGYTSAYTVDSKTGDLLENYLPAMGQKWVTQDLTSQVHNPAVQVGTKPVALTHDGYTSVFTIDAGSGDLQETYLPKLGGSWFTHDLTQLGKTPASKVTPTAIFHSGYTSVYTVDASSGDLDETYLPALGGPWFSQNLSANYHTPPVASATSPVAILHSGWVSVYTVDGGSNDLQETYLNAVGSSWVSQDLSTNYGTPAVALFTTPTAVVHSGYTSVYTLDAGTDHLRETYLPAIGDRWASQDLTQKYGTPAAAKGPGDQIVALYHTGFTSVYTIDQTTGDLWETYLPAISDAWGAQDLTQKAGTPKPAPLSQAALLHYDTSGALTWTSVFTIDDSPAAGDLQETYLPAIGDNWTSQDLTKIAQ